MHDHSPEPGKRQIKWIPRARFIRRMALGIAGVAILLGIAVYDEDLNSRRGIESSRATGLSAIRTRSTHAPPLMKGMFAQTKLVEAAAVLPGTLIARDVSLSISVRDFPGARSSLDRIVTAHAGYVASMTVSSPKDATQSLSATIEVPAERCDSALAELRALGRVEEERQTLEEVTSQTEDLELRLSNARGTETRLTEILRMGTSKITDVLEVEKEMSRVREEIEQMEGEQKRLSTRVGFASITLNLGEEYQAHLVGEAPKIGLRVKNAVVDGYHNTLDGLVATLVLLLSAGPSLLVWALILFRPARWAWRRWRQLHESLAVSA